MRVDFSDFCWIQSSNISKLSQVVENARKQSISLSQIIRATIDFQETTVDLWSRVEMLETTLFARDGFLVKRSEIISTCFFFGSPATPFLLSFSTTIKIYINVIISLNSRFDCKKSKKSMTTCNMNFDFLRSSDTQDIIHKSSGCCSFSLANNQHDN